MNNIKTIRTLTLIAGILFILAGVSDLIYSIIDTINGYFRISNYFLSFALILVGIVQLLMLRMKNNYDIYKEYDVEIDNKKDLVS